MQTLLDTFRILIPQPKNFHFNWRLFLVENITSSWWLMGWLILLTYMTASYTLGQLRVAPGLTAVILTLWVLTLLMTVMGELQKHHTRITLWLKENLYSSITNVQLSLLLVLLILAAVRSFYGYAWVNASFTTAPIPAATTTTIEDVLRRDNVDLSRMPSGLPFERVVLRNYAGTPIRQTVYIVSEDKSEVSVRTTNIHTGATWGSVIENRDNLLIFRFKDPSRLPRLWIGIGLLVVLAIPSFYVYRQEKFLRSPVRKALNWLWFLLPIALYLLLRGTTYAPRGSLLESLNPDVVWGGFLLSVIIAVFAIVVSFPLGVLLALGRRSAIPGIPAWLTYSLAAVLTIWGLATSTPELAATSTSTFSTLLAYWPLIVPILAYLFQRAFNGNVVAAFSTIFIEVWRGVPFITVLFMAIILFPIFLPPGLEVLNTTRVLIGTALFSSAYLAENIRGGLQAIPKGQYEAADSLGLSTFNKYRIIIMPQALRLVIPAIVGQFIGLFKDTSLVFLVGLFDLLAVANSISSQPNWLGIRTEPYIVLFFIYFICSSGMAWYSRRLEKQLGVGER
jgi:ABC-type amino acid transport system permease subunit